MVTTGQKVLVGLGLVATAAVAYFLGRRRVSAPTYLDIALRAMTTLTEATNPGTNWTEPNSLTRTSLNFSKLGCNRCRIVVQAYQNELGETGYLSIYNRTDNAVICEVAITNTSMEMKLGNPTVLNLSGEKEIGIYARHSTVTGDIPFASVHFQVWRE